MSLFQPFLKPLICLWIVVCLVISDPLINQLVHGCLLRTRKEKVGVQREARDRLGVPTMLSYRLERQRVPHLDHL
jgi:hypothetical protein